MEEDFEIDVSQPFPRVGRWIYIFGGVLYICMGIFTTRPDRALLGISYATLNIALGVFWLGLGLSFERLNRRNLRLTDDAIISRSPLWTRRIELSDVERIQQERMRLTLYRRDRRPYTLEMSMFTYDQNQALKPRLIEYLKHQSEQHGIPYNEV